MRRPDPTTLISGAAIVVLGFFLLLDGLDGLHISFASLGPVVFAVLGVILLAGGLARRDDA